MAEPDVDEDLFADLYDGDDNDTAQTIIKTDPEPRLADNGFKQEEFESMPTIAAGSMTGHGADNTMHDAGDSRESMAEAMMGHPNFQDDMNQPLGMSEERPIGTKEDG